MRGIVFILCLCLLFAPAALLQQEICPDYDRMIFDNLAEPGYAQVRAAYSLPIYAEDELHFTPRLAVAIGISQEARVLSLLDGLYQIWLSYRNTTASMMPTELTLRVDGQIPFYELNRVKLESRRIDTSAYQLDRYGKQKG